jgi:predicted nucleic acid-binding Zn ribbon protein
LQVESRAYHFLIEDLAEHSSDAGEEKLKDEQKENKAIHLLFHLRLLYLSLLAVVLLNLGF